MLFLCDALCDALRYVLLLSACADIYIYATNWTRCLGFRIKSRITSITIIITAIIIFTSIIQLEFAVLSDHDALSPVCLRPHICPHFLRSSLLPLSFSFFIQQQRQREEKSIERREREREETVTELFVLRLAKIDKATHCCDGSITNYIIKVPRTQSTPAF